MHISMIGCKDWFFFFDKGQIHLWLLFYPLQLYVLHHLIEEGSGANTLMHKLKHFLI